MNNYLHSYNAHLDQGWQADIYDQWSFPDDVVSFWDKTARTYGDLGIFIGYEWFKKWWEAFGTPHQLLVIALRKNACIKGVFPCWLKDKKNGRYQLAALTNDHTCFFDFIVDSFDREATIGQFITLIKGLNDVRQIFVDSLRTDKDNIFLLKALLSRKLVPFKLYEGAAIPHIKIDDNYEEYWENLPAKFRRGITSKMKKSGALGNMDFSVIRQTDSLDDYLTEMFMVEASGWKGRCNTAISSDESVALFYRSLARWAMESGSLMLCFLRVNGSPVSSYLCLSSGRTVYGIKIGYHEDYSHLSPGKLLIHNMLDYLFKCKEYECFDFLGCPEAWKLEWATGCAPSGWIRIFPDTIGGWFDYTVNYGWKNVLRRCLSIDMAAVFGKGNDLPRVR